MVFDTERFYKPNLQAVYPDRLAALLPAARALAGELATGDITRLPDAVIDLLDEHAAAVNEKTTGNLRIGIARTVLTKGGEPRPNSWFLPSDAMNLASDVDMLLNEGVVAELRLRIANDEANHLWD